MKNLIFVPNVPTYPKGKTLAEFKPLDKVRIVYNPLSDPVAFDTYTVIRDIKNNNQLMSSQGYIVDLPKFDAIYSNDSFHCNNTLKRLNGSERLGSELKPLDVISCEDIKYLVMKHLNRIIVIELSFILDGTLPVHLEIGKDRSYKVIGSYVSKEQQK